MRHREWHRTDRIGWLRAAVLGANDGLISTSSLIVGVASSGAPKTVIAIAAIAGLFAGAMAMAAGEYVSVSSQADTERADLDRERAELETDERGERLELASIYVARGLDPVLAAQVAEQLMAHDALGAHARDELGLSTITAARPLQAALASAASFAVGALLPLLIVLMASERVLVTAIVAFALLLLGVLGGLAARVGGASIAMGAARVAFWGALAMAITAAVGRLVGVSP